ncbi:MAG: hypothetical protein MMC23_005613 [Stictis urceolatum]|nr:hypothetical protein [Stictis urceolata]
MPDYETAETKYVTANGIKVANQLFGHASSNELFMHIHFRGTSMPSTLSNHPTLRIFVFSSPNPQAQHPAFESTRSDHPAANPPIDNFGVGRSERRIPDSYAGWAANIGAVAQELEISKFDVPGFSMGGFTAQIMMLSHPTLVRSLDPNGGAGESGRGGLRPEKSGYDRLRVVYPHTKHTFSLRDLFSCDMCGGMLTPISAGPEVITCSHWPVPGLLHPRTETENEEAIKKSFFDIAPKAQDAANAFWGRVPAAHHPQERSH